MGRGGVLKGCICGGLDAFSLRIESVTLARPEAGGASLKATRTHSSQAQLGCPARPWGDQHMS